MRDHMILAHDLAATLLEDLLQELVPAGVHDVGYYQGSLEGFSRKGGRVFRHTVPWTPLAYVRNTQGLPEWKKEQILPNTGQWEPSWGPRWAPDGQYLCLQTTLCDEAEYSFGTTYMQFMRMNGSQPEKLYGNQWYITDRIAATYRDWTTKPQLRSIEFRSADAPGYGKLTKLDGSTPDVWDFLDEAATIDHRVKSLLRNLQIGAVDDAEIGDISPAYFEEKNWRWHGDHWSWEVRDAAS